VNSNQTERKPNMNIKFDDAFNWLAILNDLDLNRNPGGAKRLSEGAFAAVFVSRGSWQVVGNET
jgi:hypothetical protein